MDLDVVCSALAQDQVALLNQQIELCERKQSIVDDQLKQLRDEKRNNVTNENSNKLPSNWPYSSYLHMLLNCNTLVERFKLLIPTALVKLVVNGTAYGPFRAMLDTGAQPAMISAALFRKINCQTTPAIQRLTGIDSKPFTIRRKFNVTVKSWFESDVAIRETMWILPPQNEWNPVLPSAELDIANNEPLDLPLSDPEYFKPAPLHIALGVGFFAKILIASLGMANDGTVAWDTHFGAVMLGEHTESLEVVTRSAFTVVGDSQGEELNKMLERLWQLDKIGSAEQVDSVWTTEERMVEEHFVNSHRRNSEGRFVVRIPFKPGITTIGSSRQTAYNRFTYLEDRLSRQPELKEFYVEQMRESIKNGHMVEVNRRPKPNAICYYIPHHVVTKKLRVVFDASCKTSAGKSLNGVQMLGPKLQTELHTTLRVRSHVRFFLET